MSAETAMAIRDLGAAVVLLLGAAFALAGGIGLMRFPDVLTRMHAQSKAQTAGLVFLIVGVALEHLSLRTVVLLAAVLVLQFLTTPAGGVVLGRGAYRSRQFEGVPLHLDELADAVRRAERAEAAAARRERARPR